VSRLRICAVLRARPARLPAGPSGGEVRLLECGPLLVAAEVEPGELPVSAEALAVHDRVVRFLADQVDAALPARFGWIIDEAALDVRLAPHQERLLGALELTAGREQMNLRLYGPPARPLALATAGEADPKPGTRYLEGKREEARRRHEAPEMEPLRGALSALVRAERVERAAAAGSGAASPLASVYHLVDRGRSGDYRAIVSRLAARLLPVRATVSGPWPPYAYAPEGLA
jgi:hypothetical protein